MVNLFIHSQGILIPGYILIIALKSYSDQLSRKTPTNGFKLPRQLHREGFLSRHACCAAGSRFSLVIGSQLKNAATPCQMRGFIARLSTGKDQ